MNYSNRVPVSTKARIGAASLSACAVLLTPLAHAADPIVMSFSTVGDSRQDAQASKVDPTQNPVSLQDKHWLQNSKAWSRILRSIQAQKPNMLFFNGDMVMGYGNVSVPVPFAPASVDDVTKTDIVKTYTQYAFWRGMVAPLMETGTYVVPVAGNHEVQCNSANANIPACPKSGKNALPQNEAAWSANMGDLVLDSDRLTQMFGAAGAPTNVSFSSGADDGLTTDQSKLTYSFDFKGSHFVVINTDPVGADGTAPTKWLANDLSAAQLRGAKHFFVFGHKPAYTYDYLGGNLTPAAGLDTSPALVDLRNKFWDVIEQYSAIYFCGHEHIYNVMRPRGGAYQILVGSGGSPFDAKITDTTIAPTDRYYSWATVNIYASGKVVVNGYGFDAAYGPTQVLTTLTLPH